MLSNARFQLLLGMVFAQTNGEEDKVPELTNAGLSEALEYMNELSDTEDPNQKFTSGFGVIIMLGRNGVVLKRFYTNMYLTLKN